MVVFTNGVGLLSFFRWMAVSYKRKVMGQLLLDSAWALLLGSTLSFTPCIWRVCNTCRFAIEEDLGDLRQQLPFLFPSPFTSLKYWWMFDVALGVEHFTQMYFRFLRRGNSCMRIGCLRNVVATNCGARSLLNGVLELMGEETTGQVR